ncbi:MAG: coenzyme A pyrophosphatase [Xanthomarina sp.]|uniref:NUDIX hydrolase n=1 Tax=Xanthomarina TaxID=1868329 RepID=UPI000C3CEEDA|nr:CoA pyrophosphatase [Xanthomarina sp.]MAL22964.1 coenzyme A pyrophosphatase [Xanthomarina sp.]MBF62818.1 coenzyme A pyrophosphatase [Xanthomarina sp.]HAI18710.1 coenzyme A pyrophosphatase [Xanthomarina gelatinilytica]
MEFDEFCKLISKIENIPLPAEPSQLKMSPPFRDILQKKQRHVMKHAKKAGVMALFYPNNSKQTNLVLILRKTYNGVHSAQVGFPGGKLEASDASLKEAAVRETFEEIGVPHHCIEVLRELTQVYIPPSNFFVQPYIGISRNTPKFLKQDEEVEAIIEIDLRDFINEENVVTKTVSTSYSLEVAVPAFNLNGHVVWGATAMMLSEIKDLLKQLM